MDTQVQSSQTKDNETSTDASESEVMTPESNSAPSTVHTEQTEPAAPLLSNGVLAAIIIGACALIAGGLYWWSAASTNGVVTDEQQIDFGLNTAPTAIPLEEVPEVVATVNGVEIPKTVFVTNIEQLRAMLAQQGQDPSNPSIAGQIQAQALEQVVNNELLLQAAIASGAATSDEDVAQQIEQIKGQFVDTASFDTELANAGLTIDELEDNIREQLIIGNYVESVDSVVAATNVTTEDARATYDEVAAGATDESFPAFEDVEAQIIAELTNQNRQVAITELISSLRAAAEIETAL